METLPIQSRREFDQLINQVGYYINGWIQTELNFLSTKKIIFLQKTENHYRINDSELYFENNCWVVKKDDNILHTFINKSAAVFYCLLYYNNHIQLAKSILNLDKNLLLKVGDCEFLLHRIKKYNHDSFKKDVALARYHENIVQINILNQQLKKCLTNAKYIKFRKIL